MSVRPFDWLVRLNSNRQSQKQPPSKNEKGWIACRRITLRAFFGIYRKQIQDQDQLQTPIQWCQKQL